ncbi:MAG TPA: very short patch repair endonuclease [Bacillota bacterium]|jgi:DNA mismatch endonuclease (patch repair protein)|nr:very short patch repair endonuclease [Bacillota bacterium]
MTEKLTKEQRSWNMSRVRSVDTNPEKIVRSWLHLNGWRFRLHDKTLPGSPDIVMKKYGTVIFIHGCFWHSHQGCRRATIPKTNREFWEKKLKGNLERDKKAREQLSQMGWKVIVIWECEVKNGKFKDIIIKSLKPNFVE